MAAKRAKQNQTEKEQSEQLTPVTNEPWIGQRTGLWFMTLLSLVLAIYIAWQLWPSEGPMVAILWGLGFGAGIWGVFGLSLAFNRFVRRR